ncbi:MAG: TIGR02587 family membrane protein [Prochlorotrichaceae cyanobacterium]|jgi:putative integral membrane protein (TIGR02587 family)
MDHLRYEWHYILQRSAGGFLFGVPLLYTIELWSIGSETRPLWLLGALGIGFVGVFLITQAEILRRHGRLNCGENFRETVEVLAIGLICAAISLLLIRRITWETPLNEILGKLVFEGISFSFGAALAVSLLNKGKIPSEDPEIRPPDFRDTLADLDATLLGAFIIAFNIAPTDEVTFLATAIPPLWLLVLIAASLLISYLIVFAAGFTNQRERQEQLGWIQRPLSETLVAYLISLGAGVMMLWFFHQLNTHDPWQKWLSSTIVLGLPASIGGAAGRIIL